MLKNYFKIFSIFVTSNLSLGRLYEKLVKLSPILEVEFRILYWNKVHFFQKFKKGKKNIQPFSLLNFDLVIDELKMRGIGEDSILIVHSSFDHLSNSGLNAEQLNQKLIDLVGKNGTLVMPVIRRYAEEGPIVDSLKKDFQNIIPVYDTLRSPIVSGMLPFFLTRRKDAFISRFPLNPVVAVGKDAQKMTANNLVGDFLTPHGPQSAWKYCLDKNAYIVSLGVELPKYLTIIHTYEECHPNWSISDWYQKRKFIVKDKEYIENVEVYERKSIWGKYFFAERNLRKDLIQNGILEIFFVNNLEINVIRAKNLFDFLNNSKKEFYPYFIKSKFIK